MAMNGKMDALARYRMTYNVATTAGSGQQLGKTWRWRWQNWWRGAHNARTILAGRARQSGKYRNGDISAWQRTINRRDAASRQAYRHLAKPSHAKTRSKRLNIIARRA